MAKTIYRFTYIFFLCSLVLGSYSSANAKRSSIGTIVTYIDDQNSLMKFKGSWASTSTPLAYKGKTHTSKVIGNSTSIQINGSNFTLMYTKAIGKGKVDIYVDNRKISTLNQLGTKTTYKSIWNSPTLKAGAHVVKLVHYSGKVIDIDAIIVKRLDPNYYVDGNLGSDTNPGSKAQPWKTIQNAVDTLTTGQVVIVMAGNYPERVNINHSITLQGQGKVVTRGFTVTANNVTIRGFEITDTEDNYIAGWGIYILASNCVIENNYIHYATRGGILLFAKPGSEDLIANCIVRNNRLYRNAMVGIEVHGRNHLIEKNEIQGTIQYHPLWVNPPSYVDADGIRFFGSGHIFRGNYIHDISLNDPENINPHIDAFQTWDETGQVGSNCIFEQNRIALSKDTVGFQLAGGAHDLIIRNNIIQTFTGILGYKMKQSPFTSPSNLFVLNNLFIRDLEDPTVNNDSVGAAIRETTNLILVNNIFFEFSSGVISVSGNTGMVVDYNLAYNSNGSKPPQPIGSPILHNLWGVNPLFVNPGIGDYRLQAASPAIDKGIFSRNVTNDYKGYLRPQGKTFDIGIFER